MLKVASTLDGRIATARGESQWITGARARAEGHRLRSEADAVLTGAGTLIADDPMLTVRLPGFAERQPLRIVVEGRGAVSETARIWDTLEQSPVWLVSARADPARDARFAARGVRVIATASDADGRPLIPDLLEHLAAEGLTRVLVEAGSRLNAAFLKADCVDAISWFRANFVLGGDALPGIGALDLAALAHARRFRTVRRLTLDSDVLEDYQRES